MRNKAERRTRSFAVPTALRGLSFLSLARGWTQIVHRGIDGQSCKPSKMSRDDATRRCRRSLPTSGSSVVHRPTGGARQLRRLSACLASHSLLARNKRQCCRRAQRAQVRGTAEELTDRASCAKAFLCVWLTRPAFDIDQTGEKLVWSGSSRCSPAARARRQARSAQELPGRYTTPLTRLSLAHRAHCAHLR